MKKKDDGTYDIPNLYDVAGSADFRNQTHDGFCVYRVFEDEQNAAETKFINLKTKFSFQGDIGAEKGFNYHVPSGRYYAKGTHYNMDYLNKKEEPKQMEIVNNNIWDQSTPFDECPF
jgi:twinkle protein